MSATPMRFLSPPSGQYIWRTQQQWICWTWILVVNRNVGTSTFMITHPLLTAQLLLLVNRWLRLPMKNVSTTMLYIAAISIGPRPQGRREPTCKYAIQITITMHTGRSPLEHYQQTCRAIWNRVNVQLTADHIPISPSRVGQYCRMAMGMYAGSLQKEVNYQPMSKQLI